MKHFRGAIFDVDGTLLDTMYIWENLSREFLKFHGITPPEDICDRLTVKGMKQAVKYLLENFNIKMSFDEAIGEMHKVLHEYYLHNYTFKPGAQQLLQKLRERQIPCCILSATSAQHLHLALNKANIGWLAEPTLFSCSDLGISKADESTFFMVSEYMKIQPSEIIVFEDAYYSIATASKAGFPVAAIYDSTERQGDEVAAIADWYVRDWNEFPIECFD